MSPRLSGAQKEPCLSVLFFLCRVRLGQLSCTQNKSEDLTVLSKRRSLRLLWVLSSKSVKVVIKVGSILSLLSKEISTRVSNGKRTSGGINKVRAHVAPSSLCLIDSIHSGVYIRYMKLILEERDGSLLSLRVHHRGNCEKLLVSEEIVAITLFHNKV